MKTKRTALPPKKALLRETAALRVPDAAPEVDADEDQDVLIRTADAAYRLGVSENSVRLYAKQGLLDVVRIGTRTIRIKAASLARLMGQQAAE